MQVPVFHGTWRKFLVTISSDEAQLYFDDDSSPRVVDFTIADIADFDIPADAKVFLASRGPSSEQYEVYLFFSFGVTDKFLQWYNNAGFFKCDTKAF